MDASFEDFGSDLDALMARVREAAATGAAESVSLAAIVRETPDGPVDLLQVIALQGEWNDRTARSLAAMLECLQGLQDQWVQLELRMRNEASRLTALVEEVAHLRALTEEVRALQAAQRTPIAEAADRKPRKAAKRAAVKVPSAVKGRARKALHRNGRKS